MLGCRAVRLAVTLVLVVPVMVLGVAFMVCPYAVVVPYSKITVVVLLLAFTVPFSVAAVCVIMVAASVVAAGNIGKVASFTLKLYWGSLPFITKARM